MIKEINMDEEKKKKPSAQKGGAAGQNVQGDAMPLIPLRGMVVYPSTVVHFDLGREKSILALQRAMVMNQTVFLTAQKNADIDLPTPEDFYKIGTVAKVKQMLKLPGDNMRVLVEGQYRAEITAMVQELPYFFCVAERVEPRGVAQKTPVKAALMRTALNLFADYTKKHQGFSMEAMNGLEGIDDPGRLCDIIATNTDLKTEEHQELLETIDAEKRLSRLIELLTKEIEILALEDKISSQVKTRMNQNQREYYLREQMSAIQEEVGQAADTQSDAEEYRKRLEELHLSETVEKKLLKEISNLERMPGNSPDVNVLRTYIEWVLDLPWNKVSEAAINISEARRILDEDHYGLEKVKERILEFLAVRALAGREKGTILCLVGPPGVGKTSIARSVARSIGREFVHMSLGGVRDEAEIRGHRRTYIGAIPGRIMSAIKECGSRNPVFLFDEVDKIGTDFRGDPASALLEVLDPEQNREFTDHYLEVPFDLSDVMFITTANSTDTIPRPLLDRMELIDLPGYTPEEKFHIGKRHLVPKQLKAAGLEKCRIDFTDEAINEIINSYTREAGVRGLEKNIAKVFRKIAMQVVESENAKRRKRSFKITAKKVDEFLGNRKYRYDKLLGKNEVGVATGLAWTAVGGETLFIETAVMQGSGQLSLTGQLGDVMQESAKAGISYIRTRMKELGITEEFYKTRDIHIHIPEGATPKDGPSAGVTMCISVISALTGRPVHKDVAMTGEITLRGQVLPVGGIKEKMLAAHRMGISKALLPEENKTDLEELPEDVRKDIRFVLIKNVDDAIREALI